jgi:hypothetical protein
MGQRKYGGGVLKESTTGREGQRDKRKTTSSDKTKTIPHSVLCWFIFFLLLCLVFRTSLESICDTYVPSCGCGKGEKAEYKTCTAWASSPFSVNPGLEGQITLAWYIFHLSIVESGRTFLSGGDGVVLPNGRREATKSGGRLEQRLRMWLPSHWRFEYMPKPAFALPSGTFINLLCMHMGLGFAPWRVACIKSVQRGSKVMPCQSTQTATTSAGPLLLEACPTRRRPRHILANAPCLTYSTIARH